MRRKKTHPCHAGSFLAAMPSLLDPNFRRTLLFLSHHEPAEGAVGFILNRPTGRTLGDILPASPGLDSIPLHEGGPVSGGQIIVARLAWADRSILFAPLDPEVGTPDNSDSSLRGFSGYAGWSAGQLEDEILEGSWKVLPPRKKLLKPVPDREHGITFWKSLMAGMDPFQLLISGAPDHPEFN